MPEIDPRMLGTGYARGAGDALQGNANRLQQMLAGVETIQPPVQAKPKEEDALKAMLYLLFNGLWNRTQNADTQQQ